MVFPSLTVNPCPHRGKDGKGKIFIVPKIFLDTNILVYAYDSYEKKKQQRARVILSRVVTDGVPVLSTQVLQEFFSAVTTKLGMDKITAKNVLHGYHHMEIVPIDPGLIEQAIDISILSQISYWDSLIIAAAEQANCPVIYSEDLNSGQTLRGVRIENPFLGSP
jgi:predicted nucleic acid-binding protein